MIYQELQDEWMISEDNAEDNENKKLFLRNSKLLN